MWHEKCLYYTEPKNTYKIKLQMEYLGVLFRTIGFVLAINILISCDGGKNTPENQVTTNNAPTAHNLSITDSNGGYALVGDILIGHYTYDDVETDIEGHSTFRWLRNGVAISGATTSTYTIASDDSGQLISFEVTPVAITGAIHGSSVISNSITVVNSAPNVNHLNIIDNNGGIVLADDTLTGYYIFNDVDGDSEGTSIFRWFRNGITIGGATTSTYTIGSDDNGQLISFEVTPIAITGTTTGTPAISSEVRVISNPINSIYSINLSFPTPNANLIDETQATIVGRIDRNDNAIILESDIASFTVNNVPVVIDNHRWSATIPVNKGSNILSISAEYADGSTDNHVHTIYNNDILKNPSHIVLDDSNRRILINDDDGIIAVDLDANNRSMLCSTKATLDMVLNETTNQIVTFSGWPYYLAILDTENCTLTNISNETFGIPNVLVPDFHNNRVFVFDNDTNIISTSGTSLYSVNLLDGTRTIVSDDNTGTGLSLIPSVMVAALDGANNRILAINANNKLIAIDITSGDRSIISDDSIGNGPLFSIPRDMIVQPGNNRVLIIDSGLDALLAVDIITGNRSIISNTTVGSGPILYEPNSMVLSDNQLIITEKLQDAIYTLNLNTGNRAYLLNSNTGEGAPLNNPQRLTIDNKNVLVTNNGSNSVTSINLNTGDRTIVSDENTGTGPQLDYPAGIVVNPDNTHAYIADFRAGVFSVDLESGNRELIVDRLTDCAGLISSAAGIDLYTTNDHVLITDFNLNSLISANLTTSSCEVLSDSAVSAPNNGYSMYDPRSVAYDYIRGRAIVLDSNSPAILEVNLTTGYRNALLFRGPSISFPTDMAYDALNNISYVIDNDLNALLKIDFNSDNVTTISRNNNVGSGINFRSPMGLSIDIPNNRAFVVDSDKLIAVELTTGDRVISSK